MTSTRIISERDIIPNRSSGYEWTKEGLKNQEWVSPSYNSTADGALYFNVLDLAKWDAALYTEKLVKKASLDRMWTVFPLNDGKPNSGHYGFAWGIGAQHGHKLLEHSGSWQGFTTMISRYVDDGLTVVVLTNLDAGHSRPGKIAHEVAGLCNPALAVPKLTAIPDTEPERTKLARSIIESIAAGKGDPQSFTTEARSSLFPERIKDLGEFLKECGAISKFELIKLEEQESQAVRQYRLTGKEDQAVVTVRFSQEGKIAELRLSPE